MSPSHIEPADHAHRVIEAVRRAGQATAGGAVAGSWARCLNVHHLDPRQAGRPPVLGSAELEARRARMADVIECARFEMTTLYQQLGDPECAVVLTDMDGVIVQMVISPEFDSVVRPLGLEDGAVWSEAEAGTNGMGTCAAEAGPVVVHQDEHFFTEFTSLTCSAVPIHDPTGRLCAVLDVSSRSPTSPQHLLLLLGMTTRMIENRLIEMRYPDAYSIRFHSRPEFVYTLHEGKLVVDAAGRVLAANRGAALQLGLPSVPELRSQHVDKLFQCSLDDMLQRTQRAAYHPVVTYRTNAAHRFFAVARPPVRDEDQSTLPLTDGRSAPSRAAALVRLSASGAVVAGRAGATDPAPLLRDPRLQSHLDVARRVVARGTPLLLCGETGSGKEVFARAVHAASERAQRPFVAINCASLPETLIESELFGYRAGAFTGAERRGRPGKILQADGGTLFLDEIGDMPLMLQARLLRVLDERTVTPLGSEDAQAVDFQLISASHRSIPQLVARGLFREDLYYRLAGIELRLPALHERSDRAELIRAVLAQEGGPDLPISPEAWDLLMNHPWPGNVRQLRHVLRGAVALADGQVLRLSHLGALLHQGDDGPVSDFDAGPPVDLATLAPQQVQERQSLLQLLESHRWNVSHAAKALDVSRNTLYRRMHRLHIPVDVSPPVR